MEWYPCLYIGENVNNPDKMVKKIEKHSKFVDSYVIVMSKNDHDQLEIYRAAYLSQKYYRANPPYIVGLAASYEEAVDMVTHIAEETFAAKGDCGIRDYLKEKANQNNRPKG